MDKDGLINYWVETSNQDYNTMINLYESKDYNWCLFIGHLVLEKLLKALYVKNVDNNPPRIHDLLRIAEKAEIQTTEEQKDILDLITTFNISVRYPDYGQKFYNKCNYDFTTTNMETIRELREWLILIIEK